MEELFHGKDVESVIQSLPSDQRQHIINVRYLVSTFAKKIAMDHQLNEATKEELNKFGEAAFFHDIGKAWVPRKLLCKTQQLTKEEYGLIQKHTIYAKELFEKIATNHIDGIPLQLMSLAQDAAIYHHEWWNGRGYPFGLKNKNIPFIARITAVCDAYDAMTNNRVYRKAMTHSYACEELNKNAGIQFDPDLVALFLKYETEFSKIHSQEVAENSFQIQKEAL